MLGEKLFTPLQIGRLTVPNRLMMTAVNLSYADRDGKATDRLVEFYRRRAAGGAGLIIVGAMGVDPERINRAGVVQLSRDEDMEGAARVVEAIHAEGAKCFPQLWHPGAYAKPEEFDGAAPIAPSSYLCRFNRAQTREMTGEEIARQVENFAQAALRARQAGFDGVELVGSAGYLISQFLSGATNRRADRYGGGLEERLTFLREIVAAVRARAGADLPLMVRLAGNEFVPGGNDSDGCVYIAKALEECGVDALDITGGWHEAAVPQVTMDVPRGAYRYLARRVKEAVGIPVAACNRMDFQTAAAVVERGDADFAGFCRAFIADPDFANQAKAGRLELIRPCVGCNQGCLDMIFRGKPAGCLSNPEAGRETETPKRTDKRILVIGAGVAGMEYALRAARAGGSVTVWERESAPGGQMDAASARPGRHSFAELPRFQYNACIDAGVRFEFDRNAAAGDVLAAGEDYDRVVLAAGAVPLIPDIPREEGAHVVTAWDVLRGRAGTGKNVVVAGGGAVGLEAALALAGEGTLDAETLKFLFLYGAESPERLRELLTRGSRRVTIAARRPKLGEEIGPSSKWILMGHLRRYGVEQITGVNILEIRRDGLLVEREGGARELIPADTVVLALGSAPENALARELEGRVPELVVIGDALRPGKAMDAIRQAYEALL